MGRAPTQAMGAAGAAWAPMKVLRSAVCFAGLLAVFTPISAGASALRAHEEAQQAFAEAQQAVEAQRWDRAEILLERVLMLWPAHAEARIEWARLMAVRGQHDAARGLLLGLADDPRTPPDYRRQLLALAASLGVTEPPPRPTAAGGGPLPASQPAAVWRAELGVTASSNPLARTAADGLTLTLSEGEVTLPLVNRPVPGTVSSFALSRSGTSADGTWGVEVSAQGIDRFSTPVAWRGQAWGPMPSSLVPEGWRGLAWQWQLQTQQGFDRQRRDALALGAAHARWRLQLLAYREPDLDDRGFALRLDRRLPDIGPSTRPATQLVSLERSATTRLREASDPSRRPGYWRAGWALDWPLTDDRRIQAQWAAQRDSQPYSTLLQNNATRWLVTQVVAVEQQWRVGADFGLLARAYAGLRRSNLELFDYQERGLQLSLIRKW